jgi:hypothetical protein
MPLAVISDLAMAGVNSDLIPSVMPPSLLTHCNNVRAVSGGISPFGGHSNLFDFPDKTAVPGDMLYINSATTKSWFIPCNKKVFRLEANFTDVSPASMTDVGDVSKWTSTDLGGIPVINHPAIGPLYMTEADTNFKPLPFKSGSDWKAAKQGCDIIVAHKQYLFALGVTNDGEYVPDSIRWSAPADIGGVPPTWDNLDTTQVAGYTTLGGSGGAIIGAKPMRDSLVIYRSQGITILDYVGGIYVWRIRHLTSTSGLISADSVVEVNGTHYFISDGDVLRNDGNTIVSIANRKIKKRMQAVNKDTFETSYAVHNGPNSEVLFCVPSSTSTYPDVAYVYNYTTDSWFVRELPNHTKSRYGLSIKKLSDWESVEGDWDGWDHSWDDDSTTPFDNAVLAIVPPVVNTDPTKSLPAKIIGLTSILGLNTEPFTSIIERTDYLIGTLGNTTTIQRIYPHIQGSGKVFIQVGSQQFPGGPISWKPPREFDIMNQRKIDMRTTGILHCYRIYTDTVTSSFLLTGVDFEYVEAGLR